MNPLALAPSDLLGRLFLEQGGQVQQLRSARTKVLDATEGSYQALFDPDLPGSLSLEERLLVAFYASALTPQAQLAAHYRERLHGALLEPGVLPALAADDLSRLNAPRLLALLSFTRSLIRNPVEGDRLALERLLQAGLEPIDVVTLGQLVAFLAYQVRLASGLAALQALEHGQ